MSNKLLIAAGWALCLAGCASNSSIPFATRHARTTLPPAFCSADAASRVSPNSPECAVFGHTWTQGDMKRTGATDAGGALKLLDPTMIVSQ